MSSTAAAEDGRLEVGAFVGGERASGAFELGNAYYDDQVPGDAPLAGARVRYRLLGDLGIELEAAFSPAVTSGNANDGRVAVAAPVIGLRAHATYDLFPWWRVTPFATLGAGTETAWFGAPADYLVETDTDVYAHWGLGARVAIGARFGLRLDARHVIGAARTEGLASSYEATAGLYYQFGGGGSGGHPAPVPTVVARGPSPAPAADRALLAKLRALAKPAMHKELASLAATDVTARESEPEPEPEPEPEEVGPEELAAATTVLGRTRYEKGSARLTRRARAALSTVARYLTDNPHATVIIDGHADGEGADDMNLALSRKRADYAKWHLVDRGITRDRIDTVGHGEELPVDDNATEQGRASNRRIEIRLVVN